MAPPTFSGLTIGLSSFETAFGYGRMWVIHCPGSLVVHLPCPRNRSGTGSPHPPAARPSDYPTLVGPLLLPPPTLRRPPQLAVGLLLLPPPPPLLLGLPPRYVPSGTWSLPSWGLLLQMDRQWPLVPLSTPHGRAGD